MFPFLVVEFKATAAKVASGWAANQCAGAPAALPSGRRKRLIQALCRGRCGGVALSTCPIAASLLDDKLAEIYVARGEGMAPTAVISAA